MTSAIRKLNRQAGVTMIEYALIAALVGVAAIIALTTLGGNISTKFTSIGTAVSSAGT
ncbi:MAG: Flp family type IVb pilin [Burkholderiales bacterium]|jgi:pilus assembly protein Flp/PilA